MENIDEGLQRRVWQRVRGEGKPLSLQPMVAAEQSMAAMYRMLTGVMQGPERSALRRLFEQERRHGRILSGLYWLQEGKPLAVKTVPPGATRPETALRKCYAQTLQAIQTYREQENDPGQGHIFRELARQEEEHARILLEILGGLKR